MPKICPEDWRNCNDYVSENPDASQCMPDSSIGFCTKKKEIKEKLEKLGFNKEESQLIEELCQIKNLTVSEYIQGLVKRDLIDIGLLIINGIIEP